MLKSASKKTDRLLAAFFLVMVVAFIPSTALAYETTAFDVDVQVNKDNSYNITETVNIDFKNEDRHGIYRYIPYQNKDGQNVAIVNGVEVYDYDYEYYDENGSTVIQIGNGDYTVTGKQTYKYSYDFTIYDDNNTSSDMLYLNLLPTGWETPIKSSKITVKLPFELDSSKLEVYSGFAGQKNTSDVSWSYNKENTTLSIEGLYLLKGEGITVYCPLPEGTWVGQTDTSWIRPYILIPLLLVLIVPAILWFFFGRDRDFVQTVEFYPPNNMTPAEIGFAIDNTADDDDLVAMITYFAHKGYLEIEEYEKDKYRFNKLMDIPKSEATYAITLFDGLFAGNRKTVSIDDLDEDFGLTFEASKELLDGLFDGDKAQVENSSTVAYWIGALLSGLSVFGSMFLTSIFSRYEFIVPLGIAVSVMILIASTLFYARKCFIHATSKIGNIFYILVGGGVFLAGTGLGFYLLTYTGSLIIPAFFAVSVAISVLLLSNMQRRTSYGAQLLGRILGFKNFIETAELDRIKMLVDESPEYYFDILPYAYVLGLTDKWSEKFESIALTPPKWYVSSHGGYSPYSYLWYGSMMNSMSNNFSSNIQIPDSSDGVGGGSFSGGGGFSGGGFGGGGGGAW